MKYRIPRHLKILFNDVIYFKDNVNNKNQLWRRAYARALFACFDAYLWFAKTVIIKEFDDEEGNGWGLLPEEKEVLKELRYNNRGKTLRKKYYLPVDVTFEKICEIISEYTYIKYKINKNDPNWKCFQNSVKIRNKVSHPKGSVDIRIDEKQLKILLGAEKWFWENYHKIFHHIANFYYKEALYHMGMKR